MHDKYIKQQVFILCNQTLVISFLYYQYIQHLNSDISNIMSLVVISMAIYVLSYIKMTNLNGSMILNQFANLLLLYSWQILLMFGKEPFFYTIVIFLNVLVSYTLLRFLLRFIFQDSAYIHKKQVDWILKVLSLLTLISIYSKHLYSIMFFWQWVISGILIVITVFKNKKRIQFFLNKQSKSLTYALMITAIPFGAYILFVDKGKNVFTNMVFYFIFIFPLYAVYSIVQNNVKKSIQLTQLSTLNKWILMLVSVASIGILGQIFNVAPLFYMIVFHSIVWLLIFYYLLLYKQIKRSSEMEQATQQKQYDSYVSRVTQIAKEEQIKKEFSDYLHDEILQDLLAVKNMMNKSNKAEVQQMITETLTRLNTSIRNQMQEYHPTLLSSLTLKQNYENLLQIIKKNYANKQITVSFTCREDLFLVEPYHFILYRLIKELTTNAFKHSQGSQIWIKLTQHMERIQLTVEDDGIGLNPTEYKHKQGHRGLYSIQEQIALLEGTMSFSIRKPHGLSIQIVLPMKGEQSYEYFINR